MAVLPGSPISFVGLQHDDSLLSDVLTACSSFVSPREREANSPLESQRCSWQPEARGPGHRAREVGPLPRPVGRAGPACSGSGPFRGERSARRHEAGSGRPLSPPPPPRGSPSLCPAHVTLLIRLQRAGGKVHRVYDPCPQCGRPLCPPPGWSTSPSRRPVCPSGHPRRAPERSCRPPAGTSDGLCLPSASLSPDSGHGSSLPVCVADRGPRRERTTTQLPFG